MDVRYLDYIIEIAEQKNMTKAAEKLFVSQSLLSQHLSKLEAELGTPLFTRTKSELIPTPAGNMYLQAAHSIVQIQKKLYQNISRLSETGHISLGITSNWGLEMITDIIPKFKELFPNVVIEVIEDNILPMTKMILSEKLDIALMSVNHLNGFTDQYELLRKEEVIFAVPESHSYCTLHNNAIKEISSSQLEKVFKNDSFILSKKGSTIRNIVDDVLKITQFSPDTICEMNSMLTVRKMVSKGVGVAFMPVSCADSDCGIFYFSLSPKVYRYNIAAYRKHLVFNPAETYLMSLIKEHKFYQGSF
ncbi:LysR family transcriptional regulator [Cellulosilyticum sp. I15G10I2]|uniref:LysR family transcriptional regulator n=1 Tax=Cellulosilyticum sp. I15G10I2 TaxID=1892843 RepID=UPI00085BC22C|nr:LysR family transcriptional regulator [Cellulosilyticum sp. I15G10I2]